MSALHGRVAVVTGGSRGVGFGIAQELSDQGALVVLTGLEQAEIDHAVSAIGGSCCGFCADVTSPEQMDTLYRAVMDRHGRLDAVVANAGIGDHAPLDSITSRQFDRTFRTDVHGVLLTVQKAVPLMKVGGSIVIIASAATNKPPPAMSVYAGAKAAVRAMVRVWIQDIKGSGIRINVLSPGAVDTPSLRRGLSEAGGQDQLQHAVDTIAAGNALGRLAQPSEIGQAAAFLLSDAASYITGIELFVDGGMAQY